MPIITLPDGSTRSFDQPVAVLDVAKSISRGLAKVAVAAKVDDSWVDTSYLIDSNVSLSIVTLQDDDALDVVRHSAAHLLAQAVKLLFPDAQVTIGPVGRYGRWYRW